MMFRLKIKRFALFVTIMWVVPSASPLIAKWSVGLVQYSAMAGLQNEFADMLGKRSVLPTSMEELQRLRCRVAFHALQFHSEIQALGWRMLERLRAWGQPCLVFHSGLVRDILAYHGCAELFQVNLFLFCFEIVLVYLLLILV
ncbi:hypothetical protein SAY87_012857 [Trapa incisa]|uniref:Uncharacterized protein n=1 Tax=Trapa incisa TaxID=236973 RepID=A0AAN7JK48_9MYRT|nr:hypothetical protein SAY87_012857 [Trapa incisa]